jgi:hypothetical protein
MWSPSPSERKGELLDGFAHEASVVARLDGGCHVLDFIP